MSRLTLKSNNTLVLITPSPAFKPGTETGYVFGGVQAASFGFSMSREKGKQVGSSFYQIDDINRHPDVDLNIDYLFSPHMENEYLMGFNFLEEGGYEPIGLLDGIKDKSYNFYFYNHPDQGEDGIEYFKSSDLSTPNSGEIIAFGNAYLTEYGFSLSNGSVPTVKTKYKCSNTEASIYSGMINSPAINLNEGNNIGAGKLNLEETFISGSRLLREIDRTNPNLHSPVCGLDLYLEDIQVGGQNIVNEKHILQNFSVTIPINRVDLYGMGSNYPYDRKLKYPINGNISISSRVSKYEGGFISGLLASEKDYSFSLRALDSNGSSYAIKYFFDGVKLESMNHQMEVNDEIAYSASFSFNCYDINELGRKKASFANPLDEHRNGGLNALLYNFGPTEVFDENKILIRTTSEDIPNNWSFDDQNAYSLIIGSDVKNIGNDAFNNCYNLGGFLNLSDELESIGNDAFKNCYNLTGRLYLGRGVTGIKKGAFYNCSGFNDLSLGDGIKTIPSGAFYNCNQFKGDLIIKDDVTNVGKEAFYGCTGFDSKITISDNTSIGPDAFLLCNFNELAISESVKNIQDSSFDYWSESEVKLTMPSSLETIGNYSFDNYNFTGDLKIPRYADYVGDGAFLNCSGFNGLIKLGSNLTGIGDGSFSNCKNLNGGLVFPLTLKNIGNSGFYNCHNLEGEILLSTATTGIGSEAFYNCSGLIGDLKIHDSIKRLGDKSFANCSGLTGTLTISSNQNTEVGSDTFSGCNFNNIRISNNVILIEDQDFDSLSKLNASLEIGKNVTGINSGSFDGFDFKGYLYIPLKNKNIGDYAFSGCDGFSGDLNIGVNTDYVGNGSFYGCSGFDGRLILNEKINIINEYSFYECNKLTGNLIIPNNVTRIKDYAFYNCESLNGILDIDNSNRPLIIDQIGSNSFAKSDSLTGSLIFPNTLISIGDAAFSGCSGFNGNLEIPESVTGIGDAAFYDCESLNKSLIIGTGHNVGSQVFSGCSFTNLTINGFVENINSSDFSYYDSFVNSSSLDIRNGPITIEDYAFSGYGFTGDFRIPESINSVGISSFEDSLFNGNLVIGSGLKFIYEKAFKNVPFGGEFKIENVETEPVLIGGINVSRPNSSDLEDIGAEAFYNCTGFTGGLTLPWACKDVRSGAFYNCTGFNKDLSMNGVQRTGPIAFKNCGFTGDLTFSPFFTGIEEEAFKNCSGFNGNLTLKGLSYWFPRTIGKSAFHNCSNFNGKLELYQDGPVNSVSIGDYAFANCSGFDTLCISNNIQPGVNSFSGCNFKELCVYQGYNSPLVKADYEWYKNEPYNFDDQSILTFDESVTIIGTETFSGYNFTGDLDLSSNFLTEIGDAAFYDCTGFNGFLNISASINTVGDFAFANCTGLKGSLTVGNNTVISDTAFSGVSFDSLFIQNGTTIINDGDFDFYSGFETPIILNIDLEEIGDYSFNDYKVSGNLLLPESLQKINSYAFYNCAGLTGSLEIPEFTKLGPYAFENCGFNSISIPFNTLNVTDDILTIEQGDYDYISGSTQFLNLNSSITGIGSQAFKDYSLVSAPSFNPEIVAIGQSAFQGCSSMLGRISFDCNNVTIEEYAFSGCTQLDSLKIGTGCSISQTAFTGCNSLKTLVVPGCINQLNSGDYSFYSGLNLDVGGSLIIEDDVTGIGYASFKDFRFTGSLNFPSNITSVGASAFENCEFTSQSIYPDSLINIGDYAFKNTKFKDLNYVKLLKNIGIGSYENYGSPFPGSTQLTDLVNIETIGSSAFKNSYISGDLAIGPYCTSIGDQAFAGCSSLDGTLTIGTGLALNEQKFQNTNFSALKVGSWVTETKQQDYAFFRNFSDTASLTFEYGSGLLNKIGDNSFQGFKINSLILPKNLNEIGSKAFYNCTELENLLFEERDIGNPLYISSLTTIGDSAFENCKLKTDDNIFAPKIFELPPNLVSIGNRAFADCNLLSGALVFPDNLQSIGDESFINCSFTGQLSLPNTFYNLGNSCFKNCDGFSDYLVIPNNISSIGSECFAGCTGIGDVYISLDASNLGLNSFNGPTGDLYVENNVTGSYGGTGIQYDNMTVKLWSNYPTYPIV